MPSEITYEVRITKWFLAKAAWASIDVKPRVFKPLVWVWFCWNWFWLTRAKRDA